MKSTKNIAEISYDTPSSGFKVKEGTNDEVL